jgi:hypothetical protein
VVGIVCPGSKDSRREGESADILGPLSFSSEAQTLNSGHVSSAILAKVAGHDHCVLQAEEGLVNFAHCALLALKRCLP